MSNIDERFFPITLLNQYFVDKDTGEPLANGTLDFFRNTAQSTRKTVYQQNFDGTNYTYVPLDNPVSLSASGTVVNSSGENVAIYGYVYKGTPSENNTEIDLYHIVCKSSSGTEQWTRDAVPHINDATDPAGEGDSQNNQLSNPQFTEYFLTDSSVDLTLSGDTDKSFPIAPNWDLVASGTGTIAIERVAVAGNDALPTYPAYYLKVNVGTGVTNPYIRQRLNLNSGIWSGKYLSGLFVAKVDSGTGTVTLKYQDSSGSLSDVTIFDADLNTDWAEKAGGVLLGNSGNTQSGSNAYVDIIAELPISQVTSITSLQVIATDDEIADTVVEYDQRTANREQALMGDYYIPRLEEKRINSLLVGWDFPLNPAQFGVSGTHSSGATNTDYIWDQTILQSLAGNIGYARSSLTDGLQLTTNTDTETLLVAQYLDGQAVKKLLGTKLSVNIDGHKNSGVDDITARVYLFRGTAASSFPTIGGGAPDFIGTLNADGTIDTLQSGWAEIPRSNLPIAQNTLATVTNNNDINNDNDLGFNGWEITDSSQIADTDKFCIAVTFVVPDTSSIITLNSISLVPGDIPTRPALKTFEQVLQECEFFYEKSHNNGVTPGASNAKGALHRMMFADTSVNDGFARSFGIQYKNIKRSTTPSITFYATNGSSGAVTAFYRRGGAAFTSTNNAVGSGWSQDELGQKGVQYLATKTNALVTGASGAIEECFIKFHYVADARIAK